MNIAGVIARYLRFNKFISVSFVTSDTIGVVLKLPVPASFDELSWIKEKSENRYIHYNGSRKKGVDQYKKYNLPHEDPIERLAHSTLVEPPIKRTTSAVLCCHQTYNIVDLIKETNINIFFLKERDNVFREIKSNIALEKIVKATSEWNAINDGKDYEYYLSKYHNVKIINQ